MAKFDPVVAAQECLDGIAKLGESDRAVAEKFHELVLSVAPHLLPRIWYGMPAYSAPTGKNSESNVLVFFQAKGKFKTRYHTVGFSHHAHLDDGSLWPSAFAVTEIDELAEGKLRELIAKAVG